ncbi:MAG: hypothetical protein HC795_07475 [Coleofasciculaceae cyanobacterium RL_1_1]|jgi:hypothetical protein|nr:hypothetical protein [Coleofasciculaceae cyanobacterium RL_1_1]
MLHLVQVVKKGLLGKSVVRLLARERTDESWTLVQDGETLEIEAGNYGEGVLLVLDLNAKKQVVNLSDARDWVLKLVTQYLGQGITPDFLKREADRAEQWRQSLTLQSQDLARRTVELETRREQIQALEEKLKREKRLLQSMATQLKTRAKEQLDRE